VDLRVVAEDSSGGAPYFTGSKEHNVRLREMRHGGVEDQRVRGVPRGGSKRSGREEEDVYKASAPFVPPELREDAGGSRRHRGEAPEPGSLADIRGDLHVTEVVDGRTTSMHWSGARARKYGYVAITITPMARCGARLTDRVREQMGVIDGEPEAQGVPDPQASRWTSRGRDAGPPVRCFRLDIVVPPSIQVQATRRATTKRLVSAIRNPF